MRNERRSADPVSGFKNGEDPTQLASRHMHATHTPEKGLANGMSNFTVEHVVSTSSEHASAKGLVKDHGSCVATQDDIKIVAFYGSISELFYPKVKIGININYRCHPYLGSALYVSPIF